MKTIEERATKYANKEWTFDVHFIANESYIAGANEQKAIDIERACELLKHILREYGIILFGHWESDFRKAMEEEE